MGKIRQFFSNKWVKFGIWGGLYLLIFVVWTGNLWCLLGLPIIYDIFISKWFYRKFGYRHTEWRKRSKMYNSIMGWVDPILFAVVAATVLRIFFFENYTIPTGSMEKSLLIGDYLTVSKVAYGPKIPNTPLSFPLVHNTMPFSRTKKSYSEAIQWPYHRLKGIRDIQRYDVVVFNFPEADTVFMNGDSNDLFYYDHVRAYGWQNAQRFGQTQYRPVDKRENYVKRCVGLPGDSLEIIHGQLYVNGEPQQAIPGMQYEYRIRTNGSGLNPVILSDMGISRADISASSAGEYLIPLTSENAEKIRSFGNVTEVTQTQVNYADPMVFPHDGRYPWNQDNFGPLWVPQKGVIVNLTLDNLPLYYRIIRT
ncbi:MAG: signal peptidase I, partial [Rikenellaceae bacterium]|nr:signal peptidase I [Rikenellaceae bacterium]